MKDTTHPETKTEYSHYAAGLEVTLGTTNVHYVSTIFFCRPINSKNFRLYKPHTVAWFCFLNPLKMKNYTSLVDLTKKKKRSGWIWTAGNVSSLCWSLLCTRKEVRINRPVRLIFLKCFLCISAPLRNFCTGPDCPLHKSNPYECEGIYTLASTRSLNHTLLRTFHSY